MKSRTALLIGMLCGQLLMIPPLMYYKSTPLIESEIIDVQDNYFTQTTPLDFVIRDVPSVFHRDKRDLHVFVRSQREIIDKYREIYGKDYPDLIGFYHPMIFDATKHEVYTVNSVSVLVHEIRHVFEGFFHRAHE